MIQNPMLADVTQLQGAMLKRDSDAAYLKLNALWQCMQNDIGEDLFVLTLEAIEDCLTESQVLNFHERWGESIKATVYRSAYTDAITSYKTLRFADESRNVIIGHEGYLYLSGGRHSVLDYITGRKAPTAESFENFHNNIKSREGFCAAKNIKYMHIIYPDKQSVQSLQFPLESYECLGGSYVKRNPELRKILIYPRDELSDEGAAFHKKDTHMSDKGYCALTALLLKELGVETVICEELKIELKELLTKKVKYSGDLGSKMTPEEFDIKFDIEVGWDFYHVKNNLGVSNDGLAELYFNDRALTNMRVVIFGDSFSRLHSLFLSRCFKEVAFFRTRFFHDDIVEMAKPDLVITGNAERYLSAVDRDEMAPNFFLYPLLKGIGHAPDQDYAVAMNAFLSYPKYEYLKFKNNLSSGSIKRNILL